MFTYDVLERRPSNNKNKTSEREGILCQTYYKCGMQIYKKKQMYTFNIIKNYLDNNTYYFSTKNLIK